MLKTLALINFALAAFDAYLTRRRMHEYGIWVELNQTIQKLSCSLGIEMGVLLGIMLPVLAQTAVIYWLNWPVAFGVLIGFRLKLFVNQLMSMKFEKQLREYKKQIELGARNPNPASTPPTRPTLNGSDTNMGPSNSSEPPKEGPNEPN